MGGFGRLVSQHRVVLPELLIRHLVQTLILCACIADVRVYRMINLAYTGLEFTTIW